jgi:hypothetical protein
MAATDVQDDERVMVDLAQRFGITESYVLPNRRTALLATRQARLWSQSTSLSSVLAPAATLSPRGPAPRPCYATFQSRRGGLSARG